MFVSELNCRSDCILRIYAVIINAPSGSSFEELGGRVIVLCGITLFDVLAALTCRELVRI